MHDELYLAAKQFGPDPIAWPRVASELNSDVAKQRLMQARVNCELMKARADIRATLLTDLRAGK